MMKVGLPTFVLVWHISANRRKQKDCFLWKNMDQSMSMYCFKLKYKERKRLVLWAVLKEITLHFSCSFTWIQLRKNHDFFFRVTSCIVTCSWLFFLLLKLIPYGLGMGSFWVLSHLRSINYAKFFNIIITSV